MADIINMPNPNPEPQKSNSGTLIAGLGLIGFGLYYVYKKLTGKTIQSVTDDSVYGSGGGFGDESTEEKSPVDLFTGSPTSEPTLEGLNPEMSPVAASTMPSEQEVLQSRNDAIYSLIGSGSENDYLIAERDDGTRDFIYLDETGNIVETVLPAKDTAPASTDLVPTTFSDTPATTPASSPMFSNVLSTVATLASIAGSAVVSGLVSGQKIVNTQSSNRSAVGTFSTTVGGTTVSTTTYTGRDRTQYVSSGSSGGSSGSSSSQSSGSAVSTQKQAVSTKSTTSTTAKTSSNGTARSNSAVNSKYSSKSSGSSSSSSGSSGGSYDKALGAYTKYHPTH